jgi:hypothetical protein
MFKPIGQAMGPIFTKAGVEAHSHFADNTAKTKFFTGGSGGSRVTPSPREYHLAASLAIRDIVFQIYPRPKKSPVFSLSSVTFSRA